MIISIDVELFQKIKQIVKGRNLSIYEELEAITPLDAVATVTADTSLMKARAIKTQRIKQSIKETIKSLHLQDMKPTKYKIHKRTGIAYVTINKYYDEIKNEC
ncbi:hypothetical protein [Poseidonibacter ostreae]|uniref:Uncharacterized protein n=1 Tax=Poseidonibacter ostreae TaxID=2654171 RepID=A0ABQ6VLS1_9BACT|nr:hypothetical protein [Poseidonibacter ostreae]KAB7891554.1 hypothetical protein GBG18_06745 [Poseidonibacter ostreae]